MFGWIKKHWKKIAVIAAATVAFVAITVLTGGFGSVLAIGLGGLASGATGYTVDRWLNNEPWKLKDFVVATAVSGVLSVATFGIANAITPVIAPAIDSVVPEAVAAAVPQVVGKTVANAAGGATIGGVTQVAQNVATGRPVGENVTEAVVTGAAVSVVVAPVARSLESAPGIVGRLNGEPPSTSRTVGDSGVKPPTTETSTSTAAPPRGALGPTTPLDGLYPRGEILGEGNYKQTFTTDDPNLVLRAVKPRSSTGEVLDPAAQAKVLDEEDGMLAFLTREGVPAMKVVDRGTVLIDGTVRAADVTERYVAGSKGAGNDTNSVSPDFLAHANENTLQDLALIRSTLEQKGLVVADIQFLIKADGHVVVADPLGVYKASEVPTLEPAWKRSWAERSPYQIWLTQDAVYKAVMARQAVPTGR